MGMMRDYRVLQERHVAELERWIAEDRNRWDDWEGGRTVRSYCEGYAYRFAIAAYKGMDLGYPRAGAMLDEMRPYEELFL